MFVGNYGEIAISGTQRITTTYYYANGRRVAMRVGSTLYYLLNDHLGSTAITANSSGGKTAELRYRAYGETRYTDGTTPTTCKFTGQRLDSDIRCRREDVNIVGPWMHVGGDHRVAPYIMVPPT